MDGGVDDENIRRGLKEVDDGVEHVEVMSSRRRKLKVKRAPFR